MNAEPYPEVHWPPGWGPDHCDRFISHERRVPAPAADVFAHLTAVEDWPRWQQGVDTVEVCDDVAVGGRFVVVTVPHTLDGIIGELVPDSRFGWIAVSDGLSFYQSWLLADDPDGGTRAVFQEAARGPSALLRSSDRIRLTRSWLDALPPAGKT